MPILTPGTSDLWRISKDIEVEMTILDGEVIWDKMG